MKLLVNFILFIAGLLFIGGIGMASYYSLYNVCPPNDLTTACELDLNTNLVFIVTSIGGVLATNFGALIGLPKKGRSMAFKFSSKSPKSKLQIAAAYLYAISLLVAFVVWFIEGFTEDRSEIVPLIVELSKSFVGIIVGVFAVALGNQT